MKSKTKEKVQQSRAKNNDPKKRKTISVFKQNITDINVLFESNPKAEFVYVRENDLQSIQLTTAMQKVKVLDLSQNGIVGNVGNFLQLLPQLRHLYLTGNSIDSFYGCHDLEELEVCFSTLKKDLFCFAKHL
jgi:hypothetical protein